MTWASHVASAHAELANQLGKSTPLLAERAFAWMGGLAHGKPMHEYFMHDWGFPVLELPRWVAETLVLPPDGERFASDLTRSTIAGYYFIRLLDDAVDGDAPVERPLLPLAGFFHAEFEAPYRRYFDADHPFWAIFHALWAEAADVTGHDASLGEHDASSFVRVAARKTCAAGIPVAAVCHHFGAPELWPEWASVCDRLGCYVQMVDDTFDWPRDLGRAEGATWLLSEAKRRRYAHESVAEWMLREGLEFSRAQCAEWLTSIEASATRLGSRTLLDKLALRQRIVAARTRQLEASLQAVVRLGPELKKSLPSQLVRAANQEETS